MYSNPIYPVPQFMQYPHPLQPFQYPKPMLHPQVMQFLQNIPINCPPPTVPQNSGPLISPNSVTFTLTDIMNMLTPVFETLNEGIVKNNVALKNLHKLMLENLYPAKPLNGIHLQTDLPAQSHQSITEKKSLSEHSSGQNNGVWKTVSKPKQLPRKSQRPNPPNPVPQTSNRFAPLQKDSNDIFDISYKKGDIFSSGLPIAHCVATDFNMGVGFALEVSTRYPSHKQELRALKKKKCEVAAVPVGETDYIFYLCTKWKSSHLPRIDDVRTTLVNLRKLCQDLGVNKLALPRIGTYNDRLDWSDVLDQLAYVFAGSGVSLVVYDIPKSMSKKRRPKVAPTPTNIINALADNLSGQSKRVPFTRTTNTPISGGSSMENLDKQSAESARTSSKLTQPSTSKGTLHVVEPQDTSRPSCSKTLVSTTLPVQTIGVDCPDVVTSGFTSTELAIETTDKATSDTSYVEIIEHHEVSVTPQKSTFHGDTLGAGKSQSVGPLTPKSQRTPAEVWHNAQSQTHKSSKVKAPNPSVLTPSALFAPEIPSRTGNSKTDTEGFQRRSQRTKKN